MSSAALAALHTHPSGSPPNGGTKFAKFSRNHFRMARTKNSPNRKNFASFVSLLMQRRAAPTLTAPSRSLRSPKAKKFRFRLKENGHGGKKNDNEIFSALTSSSEEARRLLFGLPRRHQKKKGGSISFCCYRLWRRVLSVLISRCWKIKIFSEHLFDLTNFCWFCVFTNIQVPISVVLQF